MHLHKSWFGAFVSEDEAEEADASSANFGKETDG